MLFPSDLVQMEAPEIRWFVLFKALYRRSEMLLSWFGGEWAEKRVFIQP